MPQHQLSKIIFPASRINYDIDIIIPNHIKTKSKTTVSVYTYHQFLSVPTSSECRAAKNETVILQLRIVKNYKNHFMGT